MATGPVHTTLLLYTPRHRRAVLELDGKLQCEDFCVKTSWTNDWQSGSRHLLNSLAGRGYWTFLPFCGPTCLFRQTQHLADLRLVQDLTRNNLKYEVFAQTSICSTQSRNKTAAISQGAWFGTLHQLDETSTENCPRTRRSSRFRGLEHALSSRRDFTPTVLRKDHRSSNFLPPLHSQT